MHKIIFFGISIFLFGVGWFLLESFSHTPKPVYAQTNNISDTEWKTTQVVRSRAFSALKVPGVLQSNKSVVIVPRRNGVVRDVFVDIGDTVSQGQVLVSLFPQGIEGQSSAAIQEALAALQKAESDLESVRAVAQKTLDVSQISVEESYAKEQTQSVTQLELDSQLQAKKAEGIVVLHQVWETVRPLLFSDSVYQNSFTLQGVFAHAVLESRVELLASDIYRLVSSGVFDTEDDLFIHIDMLDDFLSHTEQLYKQARSTQRFADTTIQHHRNVIASQQLKLSQIRQSILGLQEKIETMASLSIEKNIQTESSQQRRDLVTSQQALSITQAEKNVELARARYNSVLVQSGHQSIISPFHGIITDRMIEVGESVQPNMPLFSLEGADTVQSQKALFEVHFSVPEQWALHLKLNDAVEISDINGNVFSGTLFRVSSQVHPRFRNIKMSAVFDEEVPDGFLHGQTLFVSVFDPTSDIVSVPSQAVKKRQNQYFVWTLTENEPQQVFVSVIADNGEFLQVRSSDLVIGDTIITNPSFSLFQ